MSYLAVYPFAGLQLHEGLATLLALRWSRLAPCTLTFSVGEHGLLLGATRQTPVDAALVAQLLSTEGFMDDLHAGFNLAELARRQFREVARIAGLLPPSVPGRLQRSLRQLQASSGLLFDVLRRHDPTHILLAQAEREALQNQLNAEGLAALLADCSARQLVLTRSASFTPLAFPLWAETVRGHLSSEDWRTRIQRAAARLERRHGR
ncbi:hypothetical protein [Lampropedia cohaerens]|uniref:hypothetical protein n=1 Tax=Lampropedia cohaerens TaxID=1610491 RepID=UPI000B1D0924|nr:hypothetical protein [Lampropedia cohaerens]